MNSSEQAYRKDIILLALVEPETINESKFHNKSELNDCDEEIEECNNMLQYFIDIKNSKEIRIWKRYLQQTKTRKRMLRSMIDNNLNERDYITT